MKTYRIYPFGNFENRDESCWWLVKVFPDSKSFKKALKEKCKKCDIDFDTSHDARGLTHSHRYKKEVDQFDNVQKFSPASGEYGVIFLQQGYTGGGVVSHEMTHAMLYTVMRGTSHLNFTSEMFHQADEYMAGIVGNLVNGFYTRYL